MKEKFMKMLFIHERKERESITTLTMYVDIPILDSSTIVSQNYKITNSL